MDSGNLKKSPMVNNNKLVPIMAYEITFGNSKGYNTRPIEEFLRFFYSTGHLELTANGNQLFVTERSAIKVHPGTEVKFNMKKGTKLYEVHVLKSEEEVLEDLTKNYISFFDTLTDDDKNDWKNIANTEKDYVVPDEPNSQHIQKLPGILIAPAFSRFKNNIGSGWNFMYNRASKVLGFGTDANYEMRPQEEIHIHKITTETYICLGGELELIVNNDLKKLEPGEFLTTEPGETHAMVRFIKTPYEGITLQVPSLPGDKFSPDGNKIERYFKKVIRVSE